MYFTRTGMACISGRQQIRWWPRRSFTILRICGPKIRIRQSRHKEVATLPGTWRSSIESCVHLQRTFFFCEPNFHHKVVHRELKSHIEPRLTWCLFGGQMIVCLSFVWPWRESSIDLLPLWDKNWFSSSIRWSDLWLTMLNFGAFSLDENRACCRHIDTPTRTATHVHLQMHTDASRRLL